MENFEVLSTTHDFIVDIFQVFDVIQRYGVPLVFRNATEAHNHFRCFATPKKENSYFWMKDWIVEDKIKNDPSYIYSGYAIRLRLSTITYLPIVPKGKVSIVEIPKNKLFVYMKNPRF